MAEVASTIKGQEAAHWKFVYIAEAHAQDEWPVLSGRCNGDRGPVVVKQPRTFQERCKLAQGFAEAFMLPLGSIALLVDDPGAGEPFEKAYAPWPLRLWLFRDGVVEWIAQPRGGAFDQAACELLGILKLEVSSW